MGYEDESTGRLKARYANVTTEDRTTAMVSGGNFGERAFEWGHVNAASDEAEIIQGPWAGCERAELQTESLYKRGRLHRALKGLLRIVELLNEAAVAKGTLESDDAIVRAIGQLKDVKKEMELNEAFAEVYYPLLRALEASDGNDSPQRLTELAEYFLRIQQQPGMTEEQAMILVDEMEDDGFRVVPELEPELLKLVELVAELDKG